MVLDGSEDMDRKIQDALTWDVLHGVTRRSWAGNSNAKWAINQAMDSIGGTLYILFRIPP